MALHLLYELQLPEHRFLLVVFQLLKNAVKTLFVRDREYILSISERFSVFV